MRIVASFEQAASQIREYAAGLPSHPELVGLMRRHRAWYAVKDEGGRWLFGPSKFVGNADVSPRSYVHAANREPGGATERVLSEWFDIVPEGTELFSELRRAFDEFAARFGKVAHRDWRVAVPKSAMASVARPVASPSALERRIAFDPDICGGRARIAGTRMRVSDIVAMLADGASRNEILEDFPYLSEEDVAAALAYAARSVDHLVLRAA